MDTAKGNKLIAELMNLKQGDSWQVWNGHRDYSEISDLKYHSEWGWLMPVIEHIESLGVDTMYTVLIQHSQCEIFQETEEGKKLLFFRESKSKITAVWLAVVAFIEWYNDQKK